jgi:hypothetical protein
VHLGRAVDTSSFLNIHESLPETRNWIRTWRSNPELIWEKIRVQWLWQSHTCNTMHLSATHKSSWLLLCKQKKGQGNFAMSSPLTCILPTYITSIQSAGYRHYDHKAVCALDFFTFTSNNWCTVVCPKCRYSEWTTDPNHQRRNYSPQLQVQRWTKHASQPSSNSTLESTCLPGTEETPAIWSALQIHSKHIDSNMHPKHLVTQLSNPPAFRRLRKLLPSDLPYRFTQNT